MMQLFRPADILLPDVLDMTAWSVVACDQFTSDYSYWQDAYKLVGEKPSTLRMILPEAELGRKDPEEESKKIYSTMSSYLNDGIFREYKDSYIYLERTLSNGMLRKGLVGMIDLEAYDWKEGTHTPIRATEFTVEDRLPPRVTVRKSAVLEMPHIMIFIDDPEDLVLSSLKKGEKLYDFELMKNGGHIIGFLVSDNSAVDFAISQLSSREKLIEKYGTASEPIVLAVGDGNHSIAAAKKYWESIKPGLTQEELEAHPARFALVESVNIHDEAISFEPIHRVLFNTASDEFIEGAREYFKNDLGSGKEITLVSGDRTECLSIKDLTIGQLIGKCEDFCAEFIKAHGGSIDYIHGDNECISMSKATGNAGILLPKMEKSELFKSVMQSGPFPKKSFSIGHADDKRYYLECRKITL